MQIKLNTMKVLTKMLLALVALAVMTVPDVGGFTITIEGDPEINGTIVSSTETETPSNTTEIQEEEEVVEEEESQQQQNRSVIEIQIENRAYNVSEESDVTDEPTDNKGEVSVEEDEASDDKDEVSDENEARDYNGNTGDDYDDYGYDDDDDDYNENYDDFGEVSPPHFKSDDREKPDFAAHVGRMGKRSNKIMPWPNAMIPYSVLASTSTKKRVDKMLTIIENKTCLNFTKRTSELRYIVIKDDDGGCWTSSIGYPSSNKKVIVGLGRGCRSRKGILHEVLHALGFIHEHSRPDRHQHIKIMWDNIKNKGRYNFRRDNRYADISIPYDYKSIMHYGRKAFAEDSANPTIVPLGEVSGRLGGSKLTDLDVQRINSFYKCNSTLSV